MQYVIEKNGKIVIGPSLWTQRLIKECGVQGNKDAPAVPLRLSSGAFLKQYIHVPCVLGQYEVPLPQEPVLKGSVWTSEDKVGYMPLEAAKAQAASLASSKRYSAEVGGICVGRYKVATDRKAQSRYSTGYFTAALDPSSTFLNEKLVSGFVDLSAMNMLAIGKAVKGHVDACFAREKELVDQINKCTSVRNLQLTVKTDEGWPETLGLSE